MSFLESAISLVVLTPSARLGSYGAGKSRAAGHVLLGFLEAVNVRSKASRVSSRKLPNWQVAKLSIVRWRCHCCRGRWARVLFRRTCRLPAALSSLWTRDGWLHSQPDRDKPSSYLHKPADSTRSFHHWADHPFGCS